MRRLLTALVLLALTGTAGAAAVKYPQPDLAGYRVIDLDDYPDQELFSFGPGEDVVFLGPDSARTRQLRIEGGDDVAVIGGAFAPQYSGTTPTATIQTKDQHGSIWIESVSIDNRGSPGSDGIVLNAAGQTAVPAYVQNVTVTNISGTQNGRHADIIQPQGRLSELNVYNLKGSTAYQGLFLARQEGIEYGGKAERVNLERIEIAHLVTATSDRRCLYLLSVGGSQQVTLRDVHLTPQPHRSDCRGGSMLNLGGASVTGTVSYAAAGEIVSGAEGPVTPTVPGGFAGVPGTMPTNPGTLPLTPGITPPDTSFVPVPPGQPPIPAVPPALTPTVPPVVHPPPAALPMPPPPPAPATVLTNIANSPILSQATPLGPGVLNGIVDTFTGQAGLWQGTLQGLALELFAILAGIEVAWVVARALARRVDFGDMIEIVAMQVVTIGFFYWLLINSADFVLAIVASFGEAANRASVAGGGMTNLSPSDIFTSGLNMVKVIWDGISITSPGLSMLLVLAGLINSYVYAVITAKLIEVLVEAAFVAYAGIIMMGFSGSSFTREYAVAQFRYAISVGVKRFVLQLIVGLAQGIITGWATTVASSGALNWTTIGIMVGAPIVMLRLCETLPQRAQDMVMGVSTYSGGHVGHTAASVAATAGAAAAGLAGTGAVAKAAYQLAAREIAQRGRQSGQTPGFAQRAAMTAGLTARNLGSALASDVGRRMIRQNRFGHRSWRMAHDLTTRPVESSQHGGQGP